MNNIVNHPDKTLEEDVLEIGVMTDEFIHGCTGVTRTMALRHDFAMFERIEDGEKAVEIILSKEFFALGINTNCIEHIWDDNDELRRWGNITRDHLQKGLRQIAFVEGGIRCRLVVNDES